MKGLKKFQYKICYSKIKKAKETEEDLDENFNTKFVIAKQIDALCDMYVFCNFNTKFVIAK